MPSRKTDTSPVEETVTFPERSESINLNPEQSKAALAAWRGLYHFFGARVDNWAVMEDGIVAEGFSVEGQYDPEKLVADISHRSRRVEIFPAIKYLNGESPEPFTDSQDMTNFMVSFYKGSVEEGTSKSPSYVRKAVATYKAEHGLKTRRGPRKKVIRLDNLTDVNAELLKDIDVTQLEALKEILSQAISQHQ